MGLFKEDNLKKIQESEKLLKKRTILIVDDEEHNLSTLKDTLIDQYDVLSATDGDKALELLKNHDDPSSIHLIISDQRMPNMTGVEFLTKSLEIVPQTIRIILTAYTDVEAIMDSINQAKIYKFILKPFDSHDILLTIRRGLEMYDLELRNQQLMTAIKFLNESLFKHIRGNLQKMMGAADLMELSSKGALSQEQANLLSTLQKSGHNLVHLLTRASDLSFTYTGHKKPRKEQLDVIQLIREEINSFQSKHSKNELKVNQQRLLEKSNTESHGLFLELDRELFTKSFTEILDNAFIYSERPANITVAAFVENDKFCLSIKDEGIGLEKEGGSSLLQPFARGKESYRYQEFGLGIGLAQAKSFLELQSGELSIIPEEVGTHLLLTLPFGSSEHTELHDEPTHRILLFQEENDDLILYTKILEFEGHEIYTVDDPNTIQEIIDSWSPHTIILDSQFQNESTVKTLKKIRANEGNDELAVVILANDPSLQNKQIFLDEGAREYLSKPIDYEHLKNYI